jgi:hypothetical protein
MAQNGAGESFNRAVEKVKHLQQTQAKPLEAPVAAPVAARSRGVGISRGIEAAVISYVLDSIKDAGSSSED